MSVERFVEKQKDHLHNKDLKSFEMDGQLKFLFCGEGYDQRQLKEEHLLECNEDISRGLQYYGSFLTITDSC